MKGRKTRGTIEDGADGRVMADEDREFIFGVVRATVERSDAAVPTAA
jgi:hypothetical protein